MRNYVEPRYQPRLRHVGMEMLGFHFQLIQTIYTTIPIHQYSKTLTHFNGWIWKGLCGHFRTWPLEKNPGWGWGHSGWKLVWVRRSKLKMGPNKIWMKNLKGKSMIMSSNGNIFRVTGPLWGECHRAHYDVTAMQGQCGSWFPPQTKLLWNDGAFVSFHWINVPWPDYGLVVRLCISRLRGILHIEAETKWPPHCRRYFQKHFIEWKLLNFK